MFSWASAWQELDRALGAQTGLRCLYDSPATACKQIRAFCSADSGSLMVRPHHQRRAEECPWYVVPSTEWPPYPFARLFADWDPDREGSLRIGAVVEKGLGVTVGPSLKKVGAKPLVMRRSWHWREIVAEGESGLFLEAVATAAAGLEGGVSVEVSATLLDANAGSDPHDGRQTWERLQLQVNRAGECEPVIAGGTEQLLAEVGTSRDLDALAAGLRKLGSEDWIWVTIRSGLSLTTASPAGKKSRKKAAAPEEPLITTNELWEGLLSPFEMWLQV